MKECLRRHPDYADNTLVTATARRHKTWERIGKRRRIVAEKDPGDS